MAAGSTLGFLRASQRTSLLLKTLSTPNATPSVATRRTMLTAETMNPKIKKVWRHLGWRVN